MASIIAQLTKELNNQISKSEIDELLHKEMENLVQQLYGDIRKIDNIEYEEHQAILNTIQGVRMMAKQFHDALAQKGD